MCDVLQNWGRHCHDVVLINHDLGSQDVEQTWHEGYRDTDDGCGQYGWRWGYESGPKNQHPAIKNVIKTLLTGVTIRCCIGGIRSRPSFGECDGRGINNNRTWAATSRGWKLGKPDKWWWWSPKYSIHVFLLRAIHKWDQCKKGQKKHVQGK